MKQLCTSNRFCRSGQRRLCTCLIGDCLMGTKGTSAVHCKLVHPGAHMKAGFEPLKNYLNQPLTSRCVCNGQPSNCFATAPAARHASLLARFNNKQGTRGVTHI